METRTEQTVIPAGDPLAGAVSLTPGQIHALGVLPGASLGTVYEWCGKLPHLRVGRKIYVRRFVVELALLGFDVAAYFEELRVRGLEDPVGFLAEMETRRLEEDNDRWRALRERLELIEGGSQ